MSPKQKRTESSSRKKSSRRNSSDSTEYKGNLKRSSDVIKGTIRRVTKSNKWGKRREIGSIFEGDLQLESELQEDLKSIWKGLKIAPPQTFKLSELDPAAIDSLGRPVKRKILQDLAGKFPEEKICVAIHSMSKAKKPEFLPRKEGKEGSKLSYAAILTLYMALNNNVKVFAELVGCAAPETVQQLKRYLRPPLLGLPELPILIHCASRHITHERDKRSPQPVTLALRTTDAISAVLALCDEFKKKGGEASTEVAKETLRKLLVGTLKTAKTDKDLGCQAGLLLAGVQRFILHKEAASSEKVELVSLFIEVSFGLLQGVPGGGFTFGPAGSLAKYFYKKYNVRKEYESGEVSQAVKDMFDEYIGGPIFLDGDCVVKDSNGRVQIERKNVDWQEFSK